MNLSERMASVFERISFGFLLVALFSAVWGMSGVYPLAAVLLIWASTFSFLSSFFSAFLLNSKLLPFFKSALFLGLLYSLVYVVLEIFNARAQIEVLPQYSLLVLTPFYDCLPSTVLPASFFGVWISLSGLFSGFCIFSTALILFKNPARLLFALFFLSANCAAMGAFAVLQKYFDFPFMFGLISASSSFYGTFYLSNACGAFLVLGMAVSLFSAVRFASNNAFLSGISLVFAAVCLFSAWYSGSLGAMLSATAFAVVAFFVYVVRCCFSPRLFELSIVGAGILFLAAALSPLFIDISHLDIQPQSARAANTVSNSVYSRLEIYKVNNLIFHKSPFWGAGVGAYSYAYLQTSDENPNITGTHFTMPEYPHSDIQGILVEYGILGGGGFLVAWLFWLAKAAKRLKHGSSILLFSGCSALLTSSAFDIVLAFPSCVLVFALCSAAVIVKIEK